MKKFMILLALCASFGFADIIDQINKATNKNDEKLLQLTYKACENKNAAACALIAAAQAIENGEYAKALPLYEKACDGRIALGCGMAAFFYSGGEHVRQDYFKAYKFYKKACDLGLSEPCYNVGVLLYNGNGVRQNYSLAKEYYGKACDMGCQEGCAAYRKLNQAGY